MASCLFAQYFLCSVRYSPSVLHCWVMIVNACTGLHVASHQHQDEQSDSAACHRSLSLLAMRCGNHSSSFQFQVGCP